MVRRKKKKKSSRKGLFLSHSSKPIITTLVCASLFAGEGESRREHRSMWVHLLCSKQTAFFKICHVVLHDSMIFFCVFFPLWRLFWHALWFCDCGETLLGSNSNLDGSHKSGPCGPLWRKTSDDDITVTIWEKKKKSHLLLHHIYCSSIFRGSVSDFWKHYSCRCVPGCNPAASRVTGRHQFVYSAALDTTWEEKII